ncbi:ATP-binding cassette domain-containing protein [Nocardioides sp. 616]|uniref:ABC transporter ATP-binding protein n=1 Tax=Nocardioides sp. 616 TaxID=2268090 RepID=UPI000CE3CE1D|nr:ATP-binding cassette domain-containing protein [Nocardioides sp. 616]
MTPDGFGTLRVRGLSRVAGGTVLVEDASFQVPSGGVVALVGPNGAGKSSLLRLIAGTASPDRLPDATPARRRAERGQASVVLDGVDLLALRRRDRARQVAVVEQDARAEFALTVRQVVALGRIPHESSWAVAPTESGEVDAALARAGLQGMADRSLATLSGGEQQRVQLARALAQQPRLLLLDEPTNHLDIRAQLDTLALLREIAGTGITVLAALHDLNLAAAHCDHVVVLAGGRVRAVGEVGEVLVPALIEETYGVAADVVAHPRTGRPLIAFSRT